jgi:hypothetical protein
VGVWLNADYLLWWIKNNRVPTIVTPGVEGDFGILGPATPQVLYGGGNANDGALSGGRFGLGLWLLENQAIGLEGNYFFLGQHSVSLASGQEASFPDGTPPGTFHVSLSSFLQGAEVNALSNLARSGVFRLDFLAGFRYLQLDEKLHVSQDFLSADFSEEDTWDDEFRTHNHFYGGQIGARAEYMYQRFFLDVVGKVALGATNQQVAIAGGLTQATIVDGTDPFGNSVENVQIAHSANGGLLTQPASYSRDRFAVVPEFGFDVGYQFTSFLRASLGYTFLYWSSVARPGDQVGGVPHATGFWAQGLDLTLALNF